MSHAKKAAGDGCHMQKKPAGDGCHVGKIKQRERHLSESEAALALRSSRVHADAVVPTLEEHLAHRAITI